MARLIEEALAAPDAPVFNTDMKEAAAIESPISAWMARPKALVEALAEPLTPSPSARGESISAFSAEPLPEDCVTPVATLEDLPGFSADALVVDVSNTDALRVVATLTCAALVGVFPAALALVAISATYGAAVNAFTYLLVPTPATPTLAVIKGSFMIFPPFLARFVAMTETYFCNLGSAMRAVPFDAAAAAAAAEEAERLAQIGRVDLTGEGLTILFMLLASFAAVAGAVLFALYPEGDVFRGVRDALTEAVEMSSPAASVANSGDVSWIAGSPEATAGDRRRRRVHVRRARRRRFFGRIRPLAARSWRRLRTCLRSSARLSGWYSRGMTFTRRCGARRWWTSSSLSWSSGIAWRAAWMRFRGCPIRPRRARLARRFGEFVDLILLQRGRGVCV